MPDSRTVYYVGGRPDQDCADELAREGASLETLPFLQSEDEVIEQAGDAAGLIIVGSPVTRRVMEALPNLKVVLRTGVGYDTIDVPAATDLGVVVVNIPDLWIREVANHALGLLLAWNRGIISLHNEIRAGNWRWRAPGEVGSLHGETVGVVGLGNIGSAFARRVAALETTVIAHDPYVEDSHFAGLGVERVSLEDLASRSDYVSVHCLLNDETHHLISDDFLDRMKPTACLINTARGPVVDEAALIRALKENRIAGAALDVHETEPLPAGNPLLGMDNVILTPHAAFFSTPAVARVPQRCGEEVAHALAGRKPRNVVNPGVYEKGTR